MNIPPDIRWFFLLAAAVSGTTLVFPSASWYLSLLLLLPVLAILVPSRPRRDRAFWLACAGIPLVVSCSTADIWAGWLVLCIGTAMVCRVMGMPGPGDVQSFGIFCGMTFLIAALVSIPNHVAGPLLVLGAVAAIILLVQSVRTYQLRKAYAGGGP